MFARASSFLLGLIALLIPNLPATAQELPPNLRPATAVAAPAFVSANFKQETIATSCSKFLSNGTFWSCSGLGTKTAGAKVLLVGDIACRAFASGALVRTHVDIRHGTGTSYDWTDFLTFPLATTFAMSSLVFQGSNVPVQYVVPPGHRLLVEATLTGGAMSGPSFSCTYSGRFMPP